MKKKRRSTYSWKLDNNGSHKSVSRLESFVLKKIPASTNSWSVRRLLASKVKPLRKLKIPNLLFVWLYPHRVSIHCVCIEKFYAYITIGLTSPKIYLLEEENQARELRNDGT